MWSCIALASHVIASGVPPIILKLIAALVTAGIPRLVKLLQQSQQMFEVN